MADVIDVNIEEMDAHTSHQLNTIIAELKENGRHFGNQEKANVHLWNIEKNTAGTSFTAGLANIVMIILLVLILWRVW